MMHVETQTKRRIEEHWSHWFEDMVIYHVAPGGTILTSSVRDLAAQYSLIAKLRDLGLPL